MSMPTATLQSCRSSKSCSFIVLLTISGFLLCFCVNNGYGSPTTRSRVPVPVLDSNSADLQQSESTNVKGQGRRQFITFRLKDTTTHTNPTTSNFTGSPDTNLRIECGGPHEISERSKTNWFKNNLPIQSNSFPNIILHPYYLEIYNSKPDNSGVYGCQIFDSETGRVYFTRNGTLIIRSEDDPLDSDEEDYYDEEPEQSQEQRDKMVSCENLKPKNETQLRKSKEPYLCFDYRNHGSNPMGHFLVRSAGAEIILACHVRGYPEPIINWFRDDKPWRPSGYREKLERRNTILRITESNPGDSGTYSCRVTLNSSESDSQSQAKVEPLLYDIRLEVTERASIRPIFTEVPTNVTTLIGDRVILRVKILSQPEFAIKWIKHDLLDPKETVIVQSRTQDLDLSTDPNLLVLDNVTEADEGWYSCIAGNAIGRSMTSAYITVVQEVQTEKTNHNQSNFHHNHGFPNNGLRESWLIPTIGFPMLITLIFAVLLLACCCHRMNKNRMRELEAKKCGHGWTKQIVIERRPVDDEEGAILIPEVNIKNIESANKSGLEYELPLDRDWEFPRENLLLGKKLGEGAFGEVYLGEAEDIKESSGISTVAVKMLKKTHTDAEMIDLISEMEIMKEMGKHVNIIKLLGCCTQGGDLLVIMEYCEHGNLRDYLRNHRTANPITIYEKQIQQSLKRSGSLSSDYTTIQPQQLKFKDLMSFAFQVARGMAYLVQKKYVHRDLAARNILVCSGNVVKIADFGMTRSTFTNDYYRKKSDGRVPVKWMAPETLFHRIYTTQSDVWSFGILLWEIVTLGGTPYPSMPDVNKLLEYLKSGQRMEKPSSCPQELYLLMRDCWLDNPKSRPTFSDLAEDMDRMLQIASDEEYMELEDDKLPEYIKTPESSPENSGGFGFGISGGSGSGGIHFDPEFLRSLGLEVDDQ